MKKVLAVAIVLLMAASAQAAVLDAINVNIVRNDNINEGVINNPGAVPAAQLPASFGTGHWNNVQLSGNTSTWTATGNTWNTSAAGGGATATALGTALTTTGASAFKLTTSTTGTTNWGTFGTADWSQSGVTSNDFHRIGYVMKNTTQPTMLNGVNVPFGNYDVYAYTTTLVGADSWPVADNSSWKKLNGATSLSGSSFSVQLWPAFNGREAVMGFQIVQVPEPATMSLVVLGGIATLIRRRNRR